MTTTPRTTATPVSVIIPTCRRPEQLLESVASALASDYPDFEVIVVDDSGPCPERARTEQRLRPLLARHANLRYLQHPERRNGSAARNTGIRAARGGYLMFLDDDDLFLPGKMAAQAAFLDAHDSTWGACYTRYTDRRDGRTVSRSGETRQGWLLREELARNLFLHAGSNLMVRREVVEALGGFDESFVRNQDMEFMVRLLKGWQLGFVDVAGLVVNLHPRPGVRMLEVTRQFLDKFRTDIQALPEEEQRMVLRMLALQQIRAVLSERSDPRSCRALMREHGLRTPDVLRYFAHLLRRRVMGVTCGYPLERLRDRGKRTEIKKKGRA